MTYWWKGSVTDFTATKVQREDREGQCLEAVDSTTSGGMGLQCIHALFVDKSIDKKRTLQKFFFDSQCFC